MNRHISRKRHLALRLALKLRHPEHTVLGRHTLAPVTTASSLPPGYVDRNPAATRERMEVLLRCPLSAQLARSVLSEISMTRRLVRQRGQTVVWRTLDDQEMALACQLYVERNC